MRSACGSTIEIADRTTNAIAVTDAQRRIEWLNPAFEQLYGYRLDDLRGQTLRTMIVGDPEDMPTLRRIVAAMEQGRSITAEAVNYRHRDGREVITRLEVTPLRDASGTVTGFMGIHEDVTEQRRAQRALQHEAQFRLLAEAAPIMAWIEDEHGSCQWFKRPLARFRRAHDGRRSQSGVARQCPS